MWNNVLIISRLPMATIHLPLRCSRNHLEGIAEIEAVQKIPWEILRIPWKLSPRNLGSSLSLFTDGEVSDHSVKTGPDIHHGIAVLWRYFDGSFFSKACQTTIRHQSWHLRPPSNVAPMFGSVNFLLIWQPMKAFQNISMAWCFLKMFPGPT